MSQEPQTIQIPDFVVRQVGALQLQLAAAQEENAQLAQQLAGAQQELAAQRPKADSVAT